MLSSRLNLQKFIDPFLYSCFKTLKLFHLPITSQSIMNCSEENLHISEDDRKQTVSKNSQQILQTYPLWRLFACLFCSEGYPHPLFSWCREMFLITAAEINQFKNEGMKHWKDVINHFTTFFPSPPFLFFYGVQFFSPCFASLWVWKAIMWK